ncbi:Serine/threonine kinase [Marasmius sp. AFHP31]|nr:Serine/threonine kinase [Marasmius sp. AFHP31]
MASDLDQKIQEVYKHIQAERKILEGAQALRQATTNPDVLRKSDTEIREAERSLSYFENALRELQTRKLQQSGSDGGRSGGPGSPQVPPKDPYGRSSGSMDMGSAMQSSQDGTRTRNYTNLDLIKADTPHTPAKISKMLHQLEFKLQVEMQYKKGIDKMAKLYQADGDKKSRADAESKKVESEKKIQLLQTALKRYKNLHVLDDVVEDEDITDGPGVDGERKENIRSKPLSGILRVTVKGARELDHAPIITRFRSASKQVQETSVSVKVEGTQLARSHPSRTDRWNEEFEITVDKANEVEIAVYDKQVGEQHAVPIGLLWIRINDLVDALRKQKVFTEGQDGWVTAGAMHGGGQGVHPDASADMNTPLDFRAAPGGPMGQAPGSQSSEGVEGWFAVEPAGAILLNLYFIKENVRKRPLDAPLGGLGRQGAVRKRKGEVHEMNGHKFVQKQFYNLMLCAFCSDFLLNATGYQCEDCRYTCHKKCHEKVVTKCISKSQTGEDEDKINHRIPHRFEPLTNLSANWCCHCGYMLPLGRKNARKCSECEITCHANCAHLVPDFCGMSMETASALLSDIRLIKQSQQSKPAKTSRPPPPQGPAHPASDPYSRPPPSAPGYPSDPRYPQQPQQQPVPYPPQGPAASPRPPPARVPVPQSPESQQGRPPSGPPDQLGGYPGPPRHSQPSPQPPLKGPGLPASPAQRYPDRTSSIPPPPPPQHPQQQQPQYQAQPPRQASLPPARQPTQKPSRKVGLDDFNFLAVLGKGNFGKVMLAEEKKTNGLYAIKVLKKEFIIDNDEVESTRSEKRVFLAAARERHPFLLGLHSCFQTETRVYFVMEYVSGGDLMLHIQRKQFSLRQAKFYASEVLLALEYFHANGIIYRDLKLDNILLTLDGHVKVADYGLCKEEMWFGSTTSTFCGTPEFMAPEILLEQRYGRAVDWWAFGVLTYEMLLGQSPFRGEDEDEIFDAILEDEPLYPITMPRDAVSILQKLLTRDPSRRLGSTKEDAEEIKRQPFFKDVNWDDVLHKRIPPPYFPTINGSADTSNFDEEFTREQPTLTPVHGQLSARDQSEFNGFSYVASWADV